MCLSHSGNASARGSQDAERKKHSGELRAPRKSGCCLVWLSAMVCSGYGSIETDEAPHRCPAMTASAILAIKMRQTRERTTTRASAGHGESSGRDSLARYSARHARPLPHATEASILKRKQLVLVATKFFATQHLPAQHRRSQNQPVSSLTAARRHFSLMASVSTRSVFYSM
jgi:hypothetical protein